MARIILTALNAKYIHTNLAVRYLKKSLDDICDVAIKEYSINDNLLSVERDIILSKPDILAFSCYIWNIEFVTKLASDIKKALPELIIILGGPEVSFDAPLYMSEHAFADYIIKGEGEQTMRLLAEHILSDAPLPKCGIVYRDNGKIIDTPSAPALSFDEIPFPYDDAGDINGMIVYYESSRGCPYSCKYCLSGEKGRVRFKNCELVKKDLKFFADNKIPLVKFVDRTFNADKKRALDIWQYIASLGTDTRFHMEITGELLDEKTIDVLSEISPDNLQFEIGVQSTNPHTLSSIDRVCDIEKLFKNINSLLERTNIHIHLDLIAGLPHEDMASFKKSFNDVISLRPHVLQLGFLKLLKGSAMRPEAEKYGMIYRDSAPYEIISNDFMSCEDIIFLKDIDFVLDKYYNSASFLKTMDFLFEQYEGKFDIFADIVKFFRTNDYISSSFSKQALYDILYDCFSHFGDDFEEALRYDYIYTMHSGKLPAWANTDNDFHHSQCVYDFLMNEDAKKEATPKLAGRAAKSLIKHMRVERFSYGILLFDYINNSVHDISAYISDNENMKK